MGLLLRGPGPGASRPLVPWRLRTSGWTPRAGICTLRAMATPSVRTRLFIMMVLEFAIWGAWLPLIFGYLPSLGFSPFQQTLILNAFPFAAVVGMFFSNQFADRNFAAE